MSARTRARKGALPRRPPLLRAHPLIVALLAISLVVLVFTLTGCSPTHGADGDPGTVAGRDSDPALHGSKGRVTRPADYDLQVERPDGTTYWIDVSSDVFDHCYKGSKYPQCATN